VYGQLIVLKFSLNFVFKNKIQIKMWKFISSKLSRRKSGAALATLIGGGSFSYFTPKLLSHHGPQPLLAKEDQPVKPLQLLTIELFFLKIRILCFPERIHF
jgi:hypothetical protein